MIWMILSFHYRYVPPRYNETVRIFDHGRNAKNLQSELKSAEYWHLVSSVYPLLVMIGLPPNSIKVPS